VDEARYVAESLRRPPNRVALLHTLLDWEASRFLREVATAAVQVYSDPAECLTKIHSLIILACKVRAIMAIDQITDAGSVVHGSGMVRAELRLAGQKGTKLRDACSFQGEDYAEVERVLHLLLPGAVLSEVRKDSTSSTLRRRVAGAIEGEQPMARKPGHIGLAGELTDAAEVGAELRARRADILRRARLTGREHEALADHIAGYTNKEIGQRLGIKSSTAGVLVKHAKDKIKAALKDAEPM